MNKELLDKLKEITEEEKEILNGRNTIDKKLYTNNKSMIIDSKKLLDSGKLIQVRPHTRFIHFPKHTHNYVEVIYMCCGQMHHIVNNTDVILNTGELLFLNQHATQEIFATGINDIAVNFIILPEFFDQSLTMIGQDENLIRNFIIDCLKNSSYSVGFLHFKVSNILPIQNLIENLIWTITNKQQNKRLMNQFTMGILFLQLLNHTDKIVVGKDNFEQKLILNVLSYIEENYKDGQLSELSEKLGYDSYWLSRTIKKITAKNYTELLQSKRLSQAVYLLNNTNLTVTDISLSVGYDNFSYFYRIFKKKYKTCPKQYRTKKMTIQ